MTSTPSGAQAPAAGNVRVVELDGKRIHLVGTAHISARSVEEVKETIDRVRPDTVCVELCAARHHSLMRPDAWREMDLFQVVRQKRAMTLLAGGQSGDPDSPHFDDQAKRYVDRVFKEVAYYKEDVERSAQRSYHPGET